MGGLLGPQLVAGQLYALLKVEEFLPPALEMGRQLLLLLIERVLLVKKALFLLGQGRLLRRHRRRLDAKGGALPLQCLPIGKQGVGFPVAAGR
jgi:hypothetical protein